MGEDNKRPTSSWPGVVALAIICATIVAGIWLTR